ncbi:glycosyltransferase family 2 protein [Actinotalea ferrariae]|uniref:glycosyltransferase family 2 protein n=1 Tax=Actinotalea ferrariae TaxID=1386098 RepID=UPI001C8B531A|nr:glycosyltransferase family 2 protein [Actinotalea ferrariae]MBX9247050.1 glycosyltransferase family 2 protein [Actinotalea ferrariae]
MTVDPVGAPAGPATAAVTAVVVTYEPDADVVGLLLGALVPQVAAVVVVDNGSAPERVAALRDACAAHPGVRLVPLPDNRGIAAAQNVGIRDAAAHGATHVLLSDQDSLPAPDMVHRLLDGLAVAQRRGPVGAVGPVTVDERNGTAALLFAARTWGPRRADLPEGDGRLVDVAFLIASGCLVPMTVLDAVGPMNEDWFIDHIDLEWGLRARRAGFALYGVTGASLAHQLGDRTQRIPGRERAVHIHSPRRNYYMVRNTLLLVRGDLMSLRWRVGYVAWITKYAVFYALVPPPRAERIRVMARAVRDALAGRAGPWASGGSARR